MRIHPEKMKTYGMLTVGMGIVAQTGCFQIRTDQFSQFIVDLTRNWIAALLL